MEWAFAPNWSATLEYDYYDFGSKGLTLTQPNEVVTVASFKDTIHAVTTGVKTTSGAIGAWSARHTIGLLRASEST